MEMSIEMCRCTFHFNGGVVLFVLKDKLVTFNGLKAMSTL